MWKDLLLLCLVFMWLMLISLLVNWAKMMKILKMFCWGGNSTLVWEELFQFKCIRSTPLWQCFVRSLYLREGLMVYYIFHSSSYLHDELYNFRIIDAIAWSFCSCGEQVFYRVQQVGCICQWWADTVLFIFGSFGKGSFRGKSINFNEIIPLLHWYIVCVLVKL